MICECFWWWMVGPIWSLCGCVKIEIEDVSGVAKLLS